MTRRSDDWRLADEWFAAFIAEAETDPIRRRHVLRERIRALPVKDTLARAFEEKTEQLRVYLAGERERMLAGQGMTA